MSIRPDTSPSQGKAMRRQFPRRLLWFALAMVGLTAAAPAMAQHEREERGPQWNQRMQQWERLPPERRERILKEQQRYQRLPPEEQQRLRQQYQQQR